MNAFRFPLQKALQYRQTQLTIEEARYKERASELDALDRNREAVTAECDNAEASVRQSPALYGGDLVALDRFRLRVKSEAARIDEQRAAASKTLAQQQQALMAARMRCKLLERLRERRLREWQAARDREVEETASESFLAGWGEEKRRRRKL